MPTFDEYQRPRVMRDASFQIREVNDETVLGPVTDGRMTRRIILISALEGALFVGIILFFVLNPDYMAKYLGLMIGALFLVGAASATSVVGLVVSNMILLRKQTRLRRSDKGELTVKNENEEDVTLERGGETRFELAPALSRDGKDLFDLWLNRDGKSYYLLSGTDRKEMERLGAELEKLCRR